MIFWLLLFTLKFHICYHIILADPIHQLAVGEIYIEIAAVV